MEILITVSYTHLDVYKRQVLNTLSKKMVTGTLNSSGYLSSVNLTNLKANWGESTTIAAYGTLQNITNPEKLQFNIPRFTAKTNRSDIGLSLIHI